VTVQIRRYVEDADLWKSMKSNAIDRAKGFSWEKCASEIYSALADW